MVFCILIISAEECFCAVCFLVWDRLPETRNQGRSHKMCGSEYDARSPFFSNFDVLVEF